MEEDIRVTVTFNVYTLVYFFTSDLNGYDVEHVDVVEHGTFASYGSALASARVLHKTFHETEDTLIATQIVCNDDVIWDSADGPSVAPVP